MDTLNRLDSSESLFFAKELTSIDNRLYETKFPLLKGRTLIPKVQDIAEAAESYEYRMVTMQGGLAGEHKMAGNRSSDRPRVAVSASAVTARIKTIEKGFDYSVLEIKQAKLANKPLSDLLARAARRATEEDIDELLAFGSTADGMTGFVNSADVDDSTFTPTPKTGVDTWLDSGAAHATGDEMVADVNKLVSQVWNQLKEAQGLGNGKLVVVLPAAEYAYFASCPRSSGTDTTALQYVLKNNPFIEAIEPWHKLSGVGNGGANRMVCYMRDPEVLGSIIPMEYQSQAPQLTGLNFHVPTMARCGGTVWRFPVAAAYGDGI